MCYIVTYKTPKGLAILIKNKFFLIVPALILANPLTAFAEDTPISLDISGHLKLYGNYVHQDGNGARSTDILRDTDVTFSGEKELSNGLTAGVTVNADGDGGDGFAIEDSFAFLSGDWGRVSMGVEDGVAFILQVAAPSADENIDGLEPFINPVSFSSTGLAGTDFEDEVSTVPLGYGNFLTAGIDKITYMTPVISGFQGGVSYTPDVANFSPASRSLNGNNTDNVLDEYGDAWEIAGRYEGKASDSITYIAGAGYTSVNTEATNSASTIDTFTEWNAGLDLDIGAFGIGTVYTENNGGVIRGNDSQTWAVGGDYTVGAIRYGASWLNDVHEESTTMDIETNRYTGGIVYDFAPGISFRGSVSHIEADAPASLSSGVTATSVTVGTQILF